MEVSPKQLEFKSDFTSATSTYLTLTNNKSVPLAFKVKTNAAKVYSVKPNISVVPPNESVKVTVTLPTLRQPLPANYKSKHKFLIISLPAEDVLPSQIQDSWPELQTKYKDILELSRVKVHYVNLNETGAVASGAAAGTAATGSPTKLNGRSKRISKFVPNGNAAGHEPNGVAGVAAGAAVGAAAGVGGSRALSQADSFNTVQPLDRKDSYASESAPRSYGSQMATQRQVSSRYNGDAEDTAPNSALSKELANIYGQTERLNKKLDNVEKLLILALMLLSFILGKSMV